MFPLHYRQTLNMEHSELQFDTLVIFTGILITANLFVDAGNECNVANNQTYSFCIQNLSYTVNCSGLSLTEVPKSYPNPDPDMKACALDLSRNNFSKLINGTFLNVHDLNTSELRVLNLSSSNISYISTEAFQGLNNLQYLSLLGNHLVFPIGFGKGVFKPLISLKYLNIKENKLNSFDGLGAELSYMKDLEGFFAELCANCKFGKDFKNLTKLKNVTLSGRSKGACNAPVLYNDTFEGLRTVSGLWLSSCNISEIEANAFRPINESLTHLDISYNEQLCFKGMNIALHGLRSSSKLSILNVNRIHNVHEFGVQLKASDLEHLSTLRNLTKLYMDLNKIEVFDKGIFDPKSLFPASLRVLTLDENRLSYGEYVQYIHNMTNITCLDLSRQHLYYDPFISDHYEFDGQEESINQQSISADRICFEELKNVQNYSECLITFPPNLRRLKWRKSFLNFDFNRNVTICGATNLVHLDLSFNLFTKWVTPVKGLEHLKYLDLSENYCCQIASDFFDHFTNLESLNIAGNFLGTTMERAFTDTPNGIFGKLEQLKDLDLSNNRIERFSNPDIFKRLTQLEHLYLQSNILSDWTFNIPDSKSLQYIDLSQNKLTGLSDNVRSYLDKLCHYQRNTCNITISLLNNSFGCNCENLPFFKWKISTEVKVNIDICRLNTEEMDISQPTGLENVVKTLEENVCKDKSWITWTVGSVSVVLGSFISLVIALVVYRNRWKLRYLYYRRNRRFNHEGFERLFEYDAFVSYAKNNASFMKYYMVPALEKERGLRLWVADRNSMPGTSIAENIIYGINTSRKSVLLVDKAYLKDSWCDFEMNMAHIESMETKRKLIVFVLMEDIPIEKLHINIMRFLRSERSLEYPEHGQDVDTFWTNLADEIMC